MTNPFVLDSHQVDEVQRHFSRAAFAVEAISVDFDTTDEFVSEVIPPCFEPAARAGGSVTVSKWQSKIVGEFDCSTVSLRVRHEGVEGRYLLHMLISGDMPVAVGRDVWGEIKKRGIAELYHDGEQVYGFSERFGTRLVEIEATFDETLPPEKSVSTLYEIKAQPDASGYGFQYDPVLLDIESTTDYHTVRKGTAELILRSSATDPLGSIPILKVGAAYNFIGESIAATRKQYPLPDRDAYLPFILARNFDTIDAYRLPQRYRGGTTA